MFVADTINRHLVDVRSVATLPETRTIDGVQVLSPAELIASKVVSHWRRRGKSKSWTDLRDISVLLQAFPDLKTHSGHVTDCLLKSGADPNALALWRELVQQPIAPETDEDDF
jgi:hypothetical protein